MGSLATVSCPKWHFKDWLLLLGDASHGIVPFFGQGMNSGFEDCSVFESLFTGDWGRDFAEFERQRQPDAKAIAEMALENFVEMRDLVGDPHFRFCKAVEHELELRFPKRFRSRYANVVYSLMPYHVAQEAGRIQWKIIQEMAEGRTSLTQIPWDRAEAIIDQRLTPYFESKNVRLGE